VLLRETDQPDLAALEADLAARRGAAAEAIEAQIAAALDPGPGATRSAAP